MSLQRVQSQLSKPLNLNAANIVAPPLPPITDIIQAPPLQPAFPVYSNGYRAGVLVVRQSIPAQPSNGQGSSHPYQMATHQNLHPILFQSEPIPNQLAAVPVPKLVDAITDQPVLGNDGTELRYFWHLPRWVDHDVSGMVMELWLRLDSRVEMRDILNRINLHPTKKATQNNNHSMKRNRFREKIQVPPFSTGRQHPESFEVDVINSRSREQILLNTCLIVDIPGQRMFKPVMSDDRSILGYVDSQLPLDYFLRGFPTPIPIPSDRQNVVLALRDRLQTLAMLHNLGTHPQNYKELPAGMIPTWWRKSADPQGPTPILLLDNLTHNQWIAQLCQRYPGITRTGTQRTTPSRPAPAPAAVAPLAPATLQPPPPTTTAPLQSAATPTQPGQAIFVMPAGQVPLVEPWSHEDGMGGFHHYVEPAHRQSVVEAAAHRAQEQAEREEEEREVEDAVRFAMRNIARHSLYDN